LTETVLMGGVATRFPKTKLQWNAPKLEFDETAANKFVQREYRTGWAVKDLA